MFIGACVGATSAYYVNLAYGRAQTKLSILQGAAYGSLLGPLAGAYPTLGAAFGFAGVYVSTRSFGGILLDPGASTRQRVASAGMILASIYGAKAGLDYAKAANAGLISTGPLEPEYVVLEHGTTFSRAKAIFRDGPDENFVEPHGSKADGFSTSRVNVATPIGNAAQYAADKSSSYPNEGGPAVLRIAVPKTIVDTARKYDNEVRFEPGRGLEELKKAWTTSVYRYPPKAE
jgi:hypothetical protein